MNIARLLILSGIVTSLDAAPALAAETFGTTVPELPAPPHMNGVVDDSWSNPRNRAIDFSGLGSQCITRILARAGLRLGRLALI